MNRVLTVLLLFTSILMCPTNVMSDDLETVAIIGTGDLGDSFGPRLAKLGYKVVYGSRTPDSDKVRALVVATGNGATASSQKEAAQRGDIVMLAVPWPAMETVAQNLGNLDGKIVIDVSFPWTQADDGYAEILVQTSSAEMIQAWNPGAKVVKGLTTMGSKIIDDPMAAGGIITIPLASNHRDAKERVAAIVVELGLDPVDVGPLRMARAMEAMGLIYMTPILQRRTGEWEFFFRRHTHFVCMWEDDWTAPVYDAGNLAEMPQTQDPPVPCP
jgi:predicted dinucleotide-binding enzyme